MLHGVHITEAALSSPTPVSLRAHHAYRSWTTDWWDKQGHRRTKRFGREDELSSRQAQAVFREWLRTEHDAKAHVRNPDDPTTFSVALLADAYKIVAERIFVKDGKPTSHVWQVRLAMNALSEAYGALPAAELDNPKIARLRDAMIHRDDGTPRAIKTVNGRLFCIKQAMKWAREKELITADALVDVLAVSPLRAGRCDAKASKVIRPIADAIVEKTLLHLPPVVRDMIGLQRMAGMRPGETCIMRWADINRQRKDGTWLYTPHRHKSEHKKIARHVVLNKSAQAILKRYMDRGPMVYLFSPVEAQAQRRADRSKARKTPAGHGNTVGTNRKRYPKRRPGVVYTAESYRKAIHYGCKLAGVPLWHPNQLRHNFATVALDRSQDRQGVAEALGHTTTDMVDVYAEPTMRGAAKVARKVG